MIKPSELLANKPTGKIVDIPIKYSERFGDSIPIFHFRIPQGARASKINDQHVRLLLGVNDGQQEQRVSIDSTGYALDMAQFVEGWEWEGEPFDRDVLKELLLEYPKLANAFAAGVRDLLEKLQDGQSLKLEEDKKKLPLT